MDAAIETSAPKLTIVRADAAPTHDPPEEVQQEEKKERRRSTASSMPDLIVGLAEKRCLDLFADTGGTAYATVYSSGRKVTFRIGSEEFRDEVTHWVDQVFRTCPTSSSIDQAAMVLAARARRSGPRRKTYLRIARHADAIYLDLCDEMGRVVRITREGWETTTECPVAFLRFPTMQPIPAPERNAGSIDELWAFLNIAPASRPLVLGWLVSTYLPEGPFPILVVNARAGCGKSTLARVLRAFVDPHEADVRLAPKDDKDVAVAARHSWLPIWDNLSSLPGWLSDMACVMSTGGAYSCRTLYSTDGETIFSLRRPQAYIGIPDLTSRGDFLDRAVVVNPETISEEARKGEKELWARFEEARPGILGALLDAVVFALRRLPSIKLEKKPRMADFALWATAAENGLGLPDGAFMAAYSASAEMHNAGPLEASPIVGPLRRLLQMPEPTVDDMNAVWAGTALPSTGCWAGLASKLLEDLAAKAKIEERSSKAWPSNGQVLSGALTRLAPNLEKVGIFLTKTHTKLGSHFAIRVK